MDLEELALALAAAVVQHVAVVAELVLSEQFSVDRERLFAEMHVEQISDAVACSFKTECTRIILKKSRFLS